MKRIFGLVLLLLIALAATPALAQDSPQFMEPELAAVFGASIRFSARLDPPTPVSQALIFLNFEGRQDTFTDEASYDPATGEVTYTYTVQPGAIAPFSDLSFQFELTLDDGTSLLSPLYGGSYADSRFDWRQLEDAPLTVHWYEGGSDFARQAADAAQAGLARIQELLPAASEDRLDIYVYAAASDMQAALGSSEAGWEAGVALPQLGAAIVSIAPGSEQRAEMERQIPHELAHLLHAALAGSALEDQPAWLREGIASQAELSPNPDFARVLEAESLIPLAELCAGFPTDPARAFLAYAQADSFVGYLHAAYGATGLRDLVDAYRDGLDCEQGTVRALGAPLSELEQDWLSSLTARPAETPSPLASPSTSADLVPFAVLLGVVLIVPLVLAFSGRRRHER